MWPPGNGPRHRNAILLSVPPPTRGGPRSVASTHGVGAARLVQLFPSVVLFAISNEIRVGACGVPLPPGEQQSSVSTSPTKTVPVDVIHTRLTAPATEETEVGISTHVSPSRLLSNDFDLKPCNNTMRFPGPMTKRRESCTEAKSEPSGMRGAYTQVLPPSVVRIKAEVSSAVFVTRPIPSNWVEETTKT